MLSSVSKVDGSWTLFLDRDGVINRRLKGGYVLRWSDFKFIPSFLRNIGRLSRYFGHVFIATNQRCIAKGLITRAKLSAIHKRMLREVSAAGCRIHRIYYCPHEIEEGCRCRKPGIGMAMRAKEDFAGIDLKKSMMVGDSPCDMEFGRKAGMTTVLISGRRAGRKPRHVDHVFADIGELYRAIVRSGDSK